MYDQYSKILLVYNVYIISMIWCLKYLISISYQECVYFVSSGSTKFSSNPMEPEESVPKLSESE